MKKGELDVRLDYLANATDFKIALESIEFALDHIRRIYDRLDQAAVDKGYVKFNRRNGNDRRKKKSRRNKEEEV